MRITRPETASQYQTSLELQDWADNIKAEIFVDGVNGDDSGAGTEVDPLKTIDAAITKAATLQTADPTLFVSIQIEPGTYNEDITLENSALTKLSFVNRATAFMDRDYFIDQYNKNAYVVINNLISTQNNTGLYVTFIGFNIIGNSITLSSSVASSNATFYFTQCKTAPAVGTLTVTLAGIKSFMLNNCAWYSQNWSITNVASFGCFAGNGSFGGSTNTMYIDRDTSLANNPSSCSVSFYGSMLNVFPKIYINTLTSNPNTVVLSFGRGVRRADYQTVLSDYSYLYLWPGSDFEATGANVSISGSHSRFYLFGGSHVTDMSSWTIGSEVGQYVYTNSTGPTEIYKGILSHKVPTTMSPSGTTQTVDLSLSNIQVLDLGSASGDVTLTLSNPRSAAFYTLKVIQGATARQLTWPAAVVWDGGGIPLLTLGEDEVSIFEFFYDGTNYYGKRTTPDIAPGQEIYVDGTNGNDTYPGTEAYPFKTIGAALVVALARNVAASTLPVEVIVSPGSYAEDITLEDTSWTNLVIRSKNGERNVSIQQIISNQDNENLLALTLIGLTCSGAVSFQSDVDASNCFKTGCTIRNCRFDSTFTASYVSFFYCYNVDWYGSMTFTNIARLYSYLNCFVTTTATLTAVHDDTLYEPYGGTSVMLLVLSGTNCRATAINLNVGAATPNSLYLYAFEGTSVEGALTVASGATVVSYPGSKITSATATFQASSGLNRYGGLITSYPTWSIDAACTVNKYANVLAKTQIDSGQLYHTIPTTMAPSGSTQTVDWDTGNIQVIDLDSASGDVTLTLSNPKAGATYVLKVIQGAVARDLVWPAAVLWPDGITPVISTTDDNIDVISLLYDGTNYLASIGQNFS